MPHQEHPNERGRAPKDSRVPLTVCGGHDKADKPGDGVGRMRYATAVLCRQFNCRGDENRRQPFRPFGKPARRPILEAQAFSGGPPDDVAAGGGPYTEAGGVLAG